MTKEEALDKLAWYWRSYREFVDKYHIEQPGRSIGAAAAAQSMAMQYMRIAGLNSTDEAVKAIRELLKNL
jgi:hypothetical protein